VRFSIVLWFAAGAAILAAQSVQQPPKSDCAFDGFDVNSNLAEVAKPTTAYYGCGTGKCLPMRLAVGDPVVVTRTEAGWTCGYLVAKKGSAPGWVRFSELRAIAADPNPPPSAWIGIWAQDENRIEIRSTKTPPALTLHGEAYWHGRGGNVNSGEFTAEAIPAANKLHIEDDSCKLDLALIGDYILANDNNMCGGMNVRFWGIWKRRAR
jgi:hypothetical protein